MVRTSRRKSRSQPVLTVPDAERFQRKHIVGYFVNNLVHDLANPIVRNIDYADVTPISSEQEAGPGEA
jgi:hypothetical protein